MGLTLSFESLYSFPIRFSTTRCELVWLYTSLCTEQHFTMKVTILAYFVYILINIYGVCSHCYWKKYKKHNELTAIEHHFTQLLFVQNMCFHDSTISRYVYKLKHTIIHNITQSLRLFLSSFGLFSHLVMF